ncbi:MAG: Na+/H+ antiporter subunit E [Pseudomonadota bacterium]
MKLLLINVLLALTWAFVSGSFSALNIMFGFLLGALALTVIREQVGSAGYFSRLLKAFSLAVLFIQELIKSSVKVATLVMTPRLDLKPGIIAYPLKAKTPAEITLLANLVTLTPGTLSVDVSDDCETLFIHALDCSEPDEIRRDIAEGFERKVMEVFQ